MGMPARIQIVDADAKRRDLTAIVKYWAEIDRRFSPFKPKSELSRLNRNEVSRENSSLLMREILAHADETKQATGGYFDVTRPDGRLDPSGIVKGWAIWNAAKQLGQKGYRNFYLEIAGDIQAQGLNTLGEPWRIGIRNPLNSREIVKVVAFSNRGIATSGSELQGDHIYDPIRSQPLKKMVSVTVIGPNIFEADRMATAAFAMGANGLTFIEELPGFEAYAIFATGRARLTNGFHQYELTKAAR